MSKSHYRLPSLNALAAFETAARRRSFKDASSELKVTPAAVSHHVKALEAELGQKLFHRLRRGVELTESGALLFASLQHGFSHIAETVERVRTRAGDAAVTISSTTAVSSLWLTPRLARFWKTHGHVRVNQHVSDGGEPAVRSDLLIRYGDMSRDSGDRRELFTDQILPLASPGFVEEHGVSSLDELAQLPLIHVNAPNKSWTTWMSWFELQGYKGPVAEGVTVNNYVIALQAAEDDMGVVLGWRGLTERAIGSGALVPMTEHAIDAPSNFYVTTSPDAPARAEVLRDWLITSVSE